MKSFPAQDLLQLEVTNFGPIAKAKIDLRPLTVFVGPSNTGKSYLAILVYALHRFFGNAYRISSIPDLSLGDRNFGKKFSQETLRNLDEWTEANLINRKGPFGENGISVPDSIADLIRSSLAGFNSLGDSLGSEINRCFGIAKTSALIRKGTRNAARVVVLRQLPDEFVPFAHTLEIKKSQTELNTTIPEQVPMRLYDLNRKARFPASVLLFRDRISLGGTRSDRSLEREARNLIRNLADFAVPHVVGPLHLPAFYLPSDRTGVMHYHAVLVNSLIRSATTPSPASTPTSMLSGILGDFLEQLVSFGSQSHRLRNDKSALGNQIEEKVLRGSVHTKESVSGFPFFTYEPEGWKGEDLPLMNASSMVSDIAPVVLYLRHIVRRENVLIVEEPESHLHPAMQVEFTRQLVALVRSGIRVIITTHSEWLLEELANLVQLSKLPETQRKGIANSDLALSPEQVGAWLFRPKNKPKGSVVKEVKLNDSGLYESGFDDVSDVLYNKWAEISGRIEEN